MVEDNPVVMTVESGVSPPTPLQLFTSPKPKRYRGYYSTVDLTWKDVNVIADVKQGWFCIKKSDGKKVILDNVFGYSNSGEVLAIMGPSGSGKSTLLNTLCWSTTRDATISGEIRANGQTLEQDISQIASYIQQEDLFIGTLTVRETLSFQANMRLGYLTPEERLNKISQILVQGELVKVAESLVGVPGGHEQCLSGGERKRLSLCLEVLLGKPLIFADEPTSGLDASMAEKIVVFLKRLASEKKNIIVTIHQPSSAVFSLFDNILLLNEGKVVYFGKRTDAPDYFCSLGYHCPTDYNPADFYIKTLVESPVFIAGGYDNVSENNFMASREAGVQYETIRRNLREEVLHTINDTNNKFPNSSGMPVDKSSNIGILKELYHLSWRNLKIILRNPALNHLRLLQHVFVAIICSITFFQLEPDKERDMAGVLFLMVFVTSLFGLFNNIQVIPTELPLFAREYRSGAYYILTWFFSKVFTEIPASAVLPLIFNTICFFTVFEVTNAVKFGYIWIICYLTVQASTAVAFFASVLGWTPLNALALSPAFYAPSFIFSGQFILIENVREYMEIFQILSFLRYGHEGAIIVFFGHYGGDTYALNGNATIATLTMDEDALWNKDLPALVGITGINYILALILLYTRTHFRI